MAKIRVIDLFWKYTNNPIEADLLYAGKYCEFTGKIDEIGKDASGRYSLRFSGYINKPPTIFCYLSPKSLADAANLKAEQTVTFTGRVVSSKKSGDDLRIEIDDCELVKPE